MALTVIDYAIWTGLRDADLIPAGLDVLEIGQANWYGDIDPAIVLGVIDQYAEPVVQPALNAALTHDLASKAEWWAFDVARAFYRAVLRFQNITCIDLHGPPGAIQHDLNEPMSDHWPTFGLVVNSGTAEHVFDQRQLWQTIHELTEPGGLMMHALPLWGWLDHGFYNYHPTFVADVAAANGYEIVGWWYAEIGTPYLQSVARPEDFTGIALRRLVNCDIKQTRSAMQYVLFRKPAELRPFAVPMQGYYAGRLDEAGNKAWRANR